jgi:hypothetical protein
MATEQANKTESNAVRIKREKWDRAASVARKVAALEDKPVSVMAVVDEILEEGLAKREKKFGI